MLTKTRTKLLKAAVIGAGNMGAGIAAHLANAGVPVLLLDIVTDPNARNAVAERALQRQLAGGGFMRKELADLVTVGNIEDHLKNIGDADWIVEAVVEDPEVKRDLYRRIDEVRKPGSVVSSNTSTIPLAQLTESLPASFASDFAITHFFNPPRAMKLMELVASSDAREGLTADIADICDRLLGKTVIECRDTPGFIANRIGNFWMSVATLEAMRCGLGVEEADAVMSAPFGIPRTGIFGLFDYVGVNLVPLVWGSFMRTLDAHDAHRRYDLTADAFIHRMLERGQTGRIAGQGFYRTHLVDGVRSRQVIDFVIGSYRGLRNIDFVSLREAKGDLRKLCEGSDTAANYAWRVLSELVCYASEVGPEIAADVGAIDTAMRLGYNWRYGPFELADRVGLSWLTKRLVAEGRAVPRLLAMATDRGGFYQSGKLLNTKGTLIAPTRAEGIGTLADLKTSASPVYGNKAASLWDIGDGVLAIEVHTKMNAGNLDVLDVLEAVPSVVQSGFRSLVIGNDHPRAFSAGADIGHFVDLIRRRNWAGLEEFVVRGQNALRAVLHGPFPVVAAPFGLALGGGCEMQLHANYVVAHAELNAGLPELRVGIVPGWGGCTRLLERFTEEYTADSVRAAKRTLEAILAAVPSTSALDAASMGLLCKQDAICMNRDRLMMEAKERAVVASGEYIPAANARIPVAGREAAGSLLSAIDEAVEAGQQSEHDARVARELVRIVTGGDVTHGTLLSDLDILVLEREAILALGEAPNTLARMEHMLNTGKPLLN
ncbi:3-hydroxyacyl-CoA dehydrogenase/enoyl-CoA hydratase family protein [Cupriavidus consociatus]|uniref:3-hydroxyacyl-CoA dehydrogenase/enoyl-CoA hydratase family protein n=1 Tax=Cupriavidus consociatus TaxID=2821357 RepID=UPI001AE252F2|nr:MULTISPECIES: 3-hydroxyacyl-CoA dehydrogenase/enoyl-CoA hydratase family protein [unclassified Cupriavidus]MBP0623766.1 enoyl-CoA hydratase/isomerase family protein [Cupriavidus sp. LEh25]MDK2660472.1 3-hydroxyacyl-CoA dehydrogenase NAD-binding domain-containing protein [Cupriavidus sp. LEh21]